MFVFVSPYRLHLFGDCGYLLDFGSQLISLPVHHLLQLQHHLSLLPLDTVCTNTHTQKNLFLSIDAMIITLQVVILVLKSWYKN